MLSTKLVNAINYQTNLDDSLQQTRHELESARKELARVRAQKNETDDMITTGVLVKKSNVDIQMAKLREELATERAAREAAERAKKQTEGELENLTTALFEEANTMVAAARKDTEAVERRNSQLKNQLSDTEMLLTSQTEQLQDLKGVMERMERTSDHNDPSVPSTPINSTTAAWDALQFSPNAIAEVPPNHPLHFSQLLAPVMRNDVSTYNDFQELLFNARKLAPHSRQGSGSTHNLSSASQTNLASSSPIPGAFSFGGGSTNNSPSSSTFGMQSIPPLKESKFYKRTLLEDIEPTLRLDLAPGLSFLSRRSVQSSLLSGSLVVEPFMPSTKFYGPIFACALCGEARKNEPYVRKHRFRTSEDDGAQRYPLCDYCLGRIRAAGDFVGFLRMVRDGHWRCESEEDAKGAWEEAVRLRERMFWARLGGGVVPAFSASQMGRREADNDESPSTTAAIKSARPSLESIPERSARENAEAAASSVTTVAGPGPAEVNEKFNQQHAREESVGSGVGGIGRAIIGASSGVMATARPDVSPSQPPEPTFTTAEDDKTNSLMEPQPTVAQEAESPNEFTDAVQTNSQVEQAQASEQLQREAEGSCEPLAIEDAVVAVEAPSISEPMPAAAEHPRTEVPMISEPVPAPEVDTQPAVTESQPPPPTERRPSAVLARVRAMEAKAQKLPGAFD